MCARLGVVFFHARSASHETHGNDAESSSGNIKVAPLNSRPTDNVGKEYPMLHLKNAQTKKTSSTPGRPTAGQAKPTEANAAQAKKDIAPDAISLEERHRRIAEAADFRALARGFNGGDPLEDWLAAEREIGQALPGSEPPIREERAA